MSSTSSLPRSSSQSLQRSSTLTPTLESLIPHLLASKRSLSSINDVYHANSLCTSTRQALEETAVITARTSFLRSGVTSQLSVLENVHIKSEGTALQGRSELDTLVQDVGAADARLNETLEKLRETIVESALRPKKEESRSLLDYVDEGGVDGLVDVIQGTVNGAEEKLEEFQNGNKVFKRGIGEVEKLLKNAADGQDGDLYRRRPSLPDILHDMEDHAHDMAKNLESLVSHYDLCVTAIKHTEGGGDAASKVTNDLPEGVDIAHDAAKAPAEPMNDDELTELMRVLEDDAGQVEGTIMDIKDRITEMESLHQQVENHSEQLNHDHESVVSAVRLLEDIGRKLPNHIIRSQVFLLHWETEKDKIEEKLEELETLTQLYQGFLKAYDNMLIEIGRRKNMEVKMEREVQAAQARLEKLYEDDLEEREAFRKEQGDFLPVDIWPALMAGPLKFDIQAADDAPARVPDISKSVIHRAIKRVYG